MSILLSMLFCNAELAYSAECKIDTKIKGFTTVKSAHNSKSYFYKEPIMCEKGKECRSIRKAYLVSDNFVQTAQIDGRFVCAIYRAFDGWGGKPTVGWLMLDDLNPVRDRIELKDLIGSWTQMKCGAGDDCGISISADKDNKLEVNIDSHLHERPFAIFNVETIKISSDKLLLTGSMGGESDKKTLELLYDSPGLEPGTVSLSGDDFFDGVYRK
jgi:hypothetical protein